MKYTSALRNLCPIRPSSAEIAALTGKARDQALNVLWRKDLANWKAQLDKAPASTGYYFPTWRPFLKAHTLALMDFTGTGIEEANVKSVATFYENLIDESRPVMRLQEQDQVGDHRRVLSVNPLQWLVALFEGLFL